MVTYTIYKPKSKHSTSGI